MADSRDTTALDHGSYVPLLERRPRQTMPPSYGWRAGRIVEAQEAHAERQRLPGDVPWSQESLACPPQPAPSAVLYRLYTENQPNPNLVNLVSRYFAGATVLRAVGLWYGLIEDAAVIEIIGTPADKRSIVRLSHDIRETNQQDCVIVTAQQVERLDTLGSDERM